MGGFTAFCLFALGQAFRQPLEPLADGLTLVLCSLFEEVFLEFLPAEFYRAAEKITDEIQADFSLEDQYANTFPGCRQSVNQMHILTESFFYLSLGTHFIGKFVHQQQGFREVGCLKGVQQLERGLPFLPLRVLPPLHDRKYDTKGDRNSFNDFKDGIDNHVP